MRRMSRFVVALLVAAAASVAPGGSPGGAPAAAAPARKAPAPRPPHKKMAISAEHKKALAELFNGFKFGMTKDEVIAALTKQLDASYDDRIKATTDIAAQDQIRREKKAEVGRVAASYVAFDSAQPSPWDVSIIESEFAHQTGEAMLERWENQGGHNQRRFFFFVDGKLWKMFVSFDLSALTSDKKSAAAFQQAMQAKYGAGEVDGRTITWRTDEFDVRAVEKLKFYDAIALAIEDPRVRAQLDATREAKAPPRKDGSAVLKGAIDTEHNDHPDTKSSSGAVDDVLRAHGAPTKP